MNGLMQDFRFGIRMLLRNASFTAVAITALSIDPMEALRQE